MAGAPHKQGLRFFAFDINSFDNASYNLQEIVESDPPNCFTFWCLLKCAIFKHSNYLPWSRFEIMNMRKFGYNDLLIDEYLKRLFKENLLDRKMFNDYGILTSKALQESFLSASQGREMVIYIKEYLLINFDDFRFFTAIVFLQTLDGVLLERFTKRGGFKVNPENTKEILKNQGHIKPKSTTKPTKAVTPVISTPVIATPPATEETYQVMKPVTLDDINAYIGIPYEKRDDIFKGTYSKDEYDNYVSLNKIINSKYRFVRKSIHQLTLPDYIEFLEIHTPSPTNDEIESCLKMMSPHSVSKQTSIFNALSIFIEQVRDAPEPPGEAEPEKTSYVKDEALEKSVLDYWGFGEINNHASWKTITAFCMVMHNAGRLEWFRTQFENYKKVTDIRGPKYKHSFDNFIGKQRDLFTDGQWDKEVWSVRLAADFKSKNNGTGNKRGVAPAAGYGKP